MSEGRGGEGSSACVVFCTASQEEARSIAKVLVEEHLAACVNIASVESFFFWKGEFCEENEALLVIKTERALIERLIKRIKQIHSYEMPEIIAIPIVDGSDEYLKWVKDAVIPLKDAVSPKDAAISPKEGKDAGKRKGEEGN